MNLIDRITAIDKKPEPAPSLKESIFSEVLPSSMIAEIIDNLEEQAAANEQQLLQLEQRLGPLLVPATPAAIFTPSEKTKGNIARLQELATYVAHQGQIISRLLVRIDL